MIPVNIPELQDKQLYEVIRQLALLSAQLSDIIAIGTASQIPTTGKRKFFWNTTTRQLLFYTGDSSIGGGTGWITLG